MCSRFPAHTPAHATGRSNPDREPQVAAAEESRDGERSDAQSHVEDDHLQDRRALHRGVGNAPGDVDDVGSTADRTNGSGRKCASTGTVIGDAPNPVTPNTV